MSNQRHRDAETRSWLVRRGQKLFGPFSDIQLKHLARDGKIREHDHLSQNAGNSWIIASSVKGLFATQRPQVTRASGIEETQQQPAAVEAVPPLGLNSSIQSQTPEKQCNTGGAANILGAMTERVSKLADDKEFIIFVAPFVLLLVFFLWSLFSPYGSFWELNYPKLYSGHFKSGMVSRWVSPLKDGKSFRVIDIAGPTAGASNADALVNRRFEFVVRMVQEDKQAGAWILRSDKGSEYWWQPTIMKTWRNSFITWLALGYGPDRGVLQRERTYSPLNGFSGGQSAWTYIDSKQAPP